MRWWTIALGTLAATPALAAEPAPVAATATATLPAAAVTAAHIPAQLTPEQRDGYQRVFAAIHDHRWSDAQLTLDGMAPGPLHAIARAELYTAHGSPRVELQSLVDLINQAPELPEAADLERLATGRGAADLPPLPMAQALVWNDGAPRRARAKAIASDTVAASMADRMQPFVKADDGASAEALLMATPGLSADATAEWQQRVAWMYFLAGRDADARRIAALTAGATGDWAVQARWVGALAAWRQHDWAAAETGFEGVAARAGDVDLRAAGLYWAARADMAAGRPDKVQQRLTGAAQYGESFYGQLARQALAMPEAKPATGLVAADWTALDARPNVRVAAALVEVGETDLADDVIRQQARIGNPAEFAGLARVADALGLPATTIWLAHNCPMGVTAAPEARYPMPAWTPDSGWRVDKALVWAHTLEESGFRRSVVSPAGAYGLMQIMPAAATDYGRERGIAELDRAALAKPSTNMDIGQRHLERLRDMPGVTDGLLLKVIAAYNAGPRPVGEWNATERDGGDPLLYIESIPYWETRGYVTTVLRNYWMYEAKAGRATSRSRAALAQGLWPRFPGLAGPMAVRLTVPVAPVASAPTTMLAAAPAGAPQPMHIPVVAPPVTFASAAPVAQTAGTTPIPVAAPPVTIASVASAAPIASTMPVPVAAPPVTIASVASAPQIASTGPAAAQVASN